MLLLSFTGAKIMRIIGFINIGIGAFGLIGCAILMIRTGDLFWPPSLATVAVGISCLGWAHASTRARQVENQLNACTVNITTPTVAVVDAERALQRVQQRLSRTHGMSR